MKKIAFVLVAMLALLPGCARVNPRLEQRIDNQGGKIDEIKNNQNGIMADIGKLRQDQQLNNSQLKDVQNGYLNLKNQMFNRENSGVQILQGDGALILVFGLGVIGMLLWHYRSMAKQHEQAADIMAQQIAHYEDEDLNERVLRAAMHTEVEGHVYKMICKYKK